MAKFNINICTSILNIDYCAANLDASILFEPPTKHTISMFNERWSKNIERAVQNLKSVTENFFVLCPKCQILFQLMLMSRSFIIIS